MALTQVRARLNGVWTVLTYNPDTGRYEGVLTPPGTSVDQPGGYYTIVVGTTNDSGEYALLSGNEYTPLRLVVREDVIPALTLISPPQGWLTTASPTFVFSAWDEEGGSGIDPASARAWIDASEVTCTATENGGVYRLTFEATGLSEGPHMVTAAISDRDGNRTTAHAAYTVDTVPPSITILSPDLHLVVDWESVEVSGYVRDETSGVSAVAVAGTPVTPDSSGHFTLRVPLTVGINNIQVAATDEAGLTATRTLWMLRLITDRTEADADAVKALLSKPWTEFTTAERAFWLSVVRGAYNTDDFNRVGTAVEYIAGYLTEAGYLPGVSPKTDWQPGDTPTPEQRQTYVDNVARLKALLPLREPEAPADMESWDWQEANSLETILVSADRLFPLMERTGWQSGEIVSGEY